MNVKGIVFSKDRPLQLDACLRSFKLHCLDAATINLTVLMHLSLESFSYYKRVRRENPNIAFVSEQDFASDVRGILAGADYILFTVDDCVYCNDFMLMDAVAALLLEPRLIGVSLLTGRNITYSYNYQRTVIPPETEQRGNLLYWPWSGSDEVFGYPLHISGAVYRAVDMERYIVAGAHSPNNLESMLCVQPEQLGRDLLACYPQSVAYDAQLNRVQDTHPNRVGADTRYSVKALFAAYEQGYRVNVAALPQTASCQQEIELPLVKEFA